MANKLSASSGRDLNARVRIRKARLRSTLFGRRVPHGIARALAFLKITIGRSRLIGVKTIVREPLEAGLIASGERAGKAFFKKGEKILRIHVDSSSLWDVKELLDALENNFGKLKTAGFIGIYGFSPNKPLLNVFKTKFGGLAVADISVPGVEAAWEKRNYRRKVETPGFPARYTYSEVKGIAVRI